MADSPTVGLVIAYPQHPVHSMLGLGARERARDLDIELRLFPATTIERYVDQLSRAVHAELDVLIVTPPEIDRRDKAFAIAGLTREVARSVRLIAAVAELGVGERCHVRQDFFTGAKLATERLLASLGGAARIVRLGGDTHVAFRDGFYAAVSSFAGVEVVEDKVGSWTFESGERLMRGALQRDQTIDGLVAGNDAMALGALRALATTAPQAHPSVVGHDAIPEALTAIREGRMLATVSHDMYSVGGELIALAERYARTDEPPPSRAIAPLLVTSENTTEIAFQILRLLPAALYGSITRPPTEGHPTREPKLVGSARGLYVSQRSSPGAEILERAISIVHRNVDERVSVAQVASAIGVSSSYLSALFRRELGRSPGRYIIDIRIERAKTLLSTHEMRVVDVAQRMGYSTRQLARIFQARVGSTPLEYARAHRARDAEVERKRLQSV